MFEIPVGDLLASYSGDSKKLEFAGAVYDGFYDDLVFLDDLELKIKIIGLDDGVSVIFENLKTRVKTGDQIFFIDLKDISREYRENKKLEDSDDIKYINKHGAIIDLKDVIREEILIECESY